MFDLRRLRLLHEFALRGTIAEVAATLSFSPSTVSQQLSHLEQDSGVALFEPDGRRIRLTAQGKALAAHAAEALALDEQARGTLMSGPGNLGTVRIAAMPTAAEALVPHALTALANRAPELRMEMVEAAPETGLFELAARGYDLVVAEQYPGHTREVLAGVEHKLLGPDPLRLALPPGHVGATLAETKDLPWVLEPKGAAARQWVVQQCRAAGFEPDTRFEATDLNAHVQLITAGHAVGVLPDLIWRESTPAVTLADLPGTPVREIFTAVRESSSASVSIRLVRDALQKSFSRGVSSN